LHMTTRPRFGFRSIEPFWSQPTNNVPSGAALTKIGYEIFGGEANTVASNSGGYLTLLRISSAVRGGFSAAKATPQRQSAMMAMVAVAPSAESQRDSATEPRVARNEPPWENARPIGDNPERVVADDNGNKTMPQPLWGCESSVTFPRVARSSQPWALLRNPFGIEDTGCP